MLPLTLLLAQTAQNPIILKVDATQAPRGVLRVTETLPAANGRVRLSLPKWIPGDHMASGTMNSIVRIHFYADKQELSWTRDSLEPFTFQVEVPPGSQLRAEFVVASSHGDNLGPKLGRIKWNRLVLLPKGDIGHLMISAALQAPLGWSIQTALRPTPAGDHAQFDEASAERLVDSPAQIGAYGRSTELAPGYWLDLVTDEPAQLDLQPGMLASFKALVAQSQRLFGAKHFGQYRFLCNVSDHIATEGLEHHESGEDGVTGQLRQGIAKLGDLVSHEMFHSWNGKYRRPKGLATRDFGTPYDTELLWVYEGLTRYYEHPLAVRSGFTTPEEERDKLATFLAAECSETGRGWRPVVDTARSASDLLQGADADWLLDRRRLDYYEEGCFVWMEVDATIRRLTSGRRSLDDFCRAFAGGRDSAPEVRPYDFNDVVRVLSDVAPYDWERLLRSRIYSVHPSPPLEGLEAAGWSLVFNSRPNANVRLSTMLMGFLVRADAQVSTVAFESPAYNAGVNAGDKILTVNGHTFSSSVFDSEVGKKRALRLTLDRDGEPVTADLDCPNGIAYPHLERIQSKPDLLSEIFKPL